MIIEFGKSYYYKKANKIVFPMVIGEDKIICSDRNGNTVVVFSSNDLVSTKEAPKNIINPSYKEPVVKENLIVSEEKITVPIEQKEKIVVSEEKIVPIEEVKPVIKKKISIEESYI